ncbi:MAG: TonB-dependent receptor, partial [Gammaproteobacteria bacterium]
MAGAGATVAIGAEDEQTTASSQAPRTLEEVVVTAQKRGAQSLLEVPISISVLSGDSLDGATFQGVAEALTTVPGMTLYTEGQNGGSKLSVRGVTAGGSLFAGSGTVAYYVDEVPFGLVKTAVVPDANAYDLERVEALRGPMGTLYGASALNGVVRIMSKQADLEDFEFKARTSISNTKDGGDNYRADMAVNIPIIEDKLAARAVIGYSDLSGWIDNSINSDTNDGELSNLRLNIKAQPTDRLSVELTNWFSRNEFGAPSVAPVPLRSPSTIDEPLSNDYNLHGLTVRYEFDGFTVTSATSYMEYESRGLQDIAAGFATLFTGLFSEVFSQEIRLHSTGEGDWQWSGGAFYREAKDDLLQTLPELLPAPIAWTDESESVAIFGELTRLFKGGDIEVTAGLRYFEDDVGVFETVRNTGVASEPLIAATSSYDTITPRLLLSWAPRDDMKVYASYSRGF